MEAEAAGIDAADAGWGSVSATPASHWKATASSAPCSQPAAAAVVHAALDVAAMNAVHLGMAPAHPDP